jgi:hypothetical protein
MYYPVLTAIERESPDGPIISREFEMVPAWILDAEQTKKVREENQKSYF